MSEIEPIEGKLVSPWPRMVPILCVLGGFLLGAIAMTLQGYGGAPKAKAPNLATKSPSAADPLGNIPTSPGSNSGTEPGEPPPGADSGQNAADPGATGEGPAADPNATPTDPNVPSTTPGTGTNPPPDAPPSLPGTLPDGPIGVGNAPLKPIVIEQTPEPVVMSAFTEYLSIVPEKDVEPTIRQVAGLVRSMGGQVQLEFEHDPDRPEFGRDMILSVPKESAEKLRDALQKSASAQESDRWSGPISERQFRMERFLREAGSTLEVRLTRLKVRYHDDAPAVVQTQDSINRIQRALKGFKRVPPEREAIRVFVGRPNTSWP